MIPDKIYISRNENVHGRLFDDDTEYIRKDSLWKPTPEQLEAMECAIIDFEEDGCNTIAGYLKEIYNQIKKL